LGASLPVYAKPGLLCHLPVLGPLHTGRASLTSSPWLKPGACGGQLLGHHATGQATPLGFPPPQSFSMETLLENPHTFGCEASFILARANGEDASLLIVPDENCPSPRESQDRLATFVCWHRHYQIGDHHHFRSPEDFISWWEGEPWQAVAVVTSRSGMRNVLVLDEFDDENEACAWQASPEKKTRSLADWALQPEEVVEMRLEPARPPAGLGGVLVPLYLTDHGNLHLSTRAPTDRCDLDWIGWAFMSAQSAIQAFGKAEGNYAKRARLTIESEVEKYSNWLAGSSWGWMLVDTSNQTLKEGWGHLGEIDQNQLARLLPYKYSHLAFELSPPF
jgi:hypothetical protein